MDFRFYLKKISNQLYALLDIRPIASKITWVWPLCEADSCASQLLFS